MSFPDSQGTTATFAGFTLGGLVGFQSTPATCSEVEVTGLDCLVVGTGAESRVIRVYQPGPIAPGTASVQVLGVPVYAPTDAGMVGDLEIVGPWGFITFRAMLSKVEVSGSVGDLVRSSMEFHYV